jgi:hypothetical protein
MEDSAGKGRETISGGSMVSRLEAVDHLIAAQALGIDAEKGFLIFLPELVPGYLIFAKTFPAYVSQPHGRSFIDTPGLIAPGLVFQGGH